MAIKLGSTDINKAYLGAAEIKKAYLGNTVVFDNSAPPINPRYQQFLDYCVLNTIPVPDAQGQTVENTFFDEITAEAGLINQIISGFFLKSRSDGVYARTDCINQTQTMTAHNSPIYSFDVGYVGNNGGGYLQHLDPLTLDPVLWALDSGHIVVSYTQQSGNNQRYIGNRRADNDGRANIRRGDSFPLGLHSSVGASNNSLQATDTVLITRDNSSTIKLFSNANPNGLSISLAQSAILNRVFYVMRDFGTSTNDHIHKYCGCGGALTDAQASAYITAINNLVNP